MFIYFIVPFLLGLYISGAPAVSTAQLATPSVTLDDGIFTGVTDGVTSKFLGIPFGKPPTGDLRFQLPEPVDPYTGNNDASAFGPSCPQQAINLPLPDGLAAETVNFIVNSIYQDITPSSEDCLSLNVWIPAAPNQGQIYLWRLGFSVFGGTELYDGGVIVKQSIELGEPIVYISMNYRVTAFGFLASKEVKDAGVGNLGLQDQRLALQWIQKYISAFGGDPTKVTIWGESAGAISVALHMISNGGNTEGLFRDYDALVAETGCSSAADTLQCLRQVPLDQLMEAVNKSPGIFSFQSLKLTWLPRVDGIFLSDTPQQLVLQGSVADIPFVTGDCDDEGTLFSLASLNITTESEFQGYITNNYIPEASTSETDELFTLYPADITRGSPFNTGILNAITPQFKRIAAIQGDLVFQAPRRFFLQNRAGQQSTWSFLSKRLKALPVLGSAHATDILNVYGPSDMTDYLINFVNNLDPNGKTGISWPQYNVASPQLLTFLDGITPLTITSDTYRTDGMNVLTNLSLQFPL
ncbi:Lipase 4 [Grifola frondosa]|uniref:Carboxylic ester hydrolase n=1 Tax=Grifola frondosa TaxID=5627 RepID=A0A1C7M7Z3_GRIFR|nr:Lipase 4 [Grifola frondosa]